MFVERLTKKDVECFIRQLAYEDDNVRFSDFVIKKMRRSPKGIYVEYIPLVDNFNGGEVGFYISDFDIKGTNKGSNDFIFETNAKHILNRFMTIRFGESYREGVDKSKSKNNELVK